MSEFTQYYVTCLDPKDNPLATFHVTEGTVLRAAQQACRQWVNEGINVHLDGCDILVQSLEEGLTPGEAKKLEKGSRFIAYKLLEGMGLEKEGRKPTRDAVWHAVYGACVARQLFDQGNLQGFDYEDRDYERWSEEAEHIADEDSSARKRRSQA